MEGAPAPHRAAELAQSTGQRGGARRPGLAVFKIGIRQASWDLSEGGEGQCGWRLQQEGVSQIQEVRKRMPGGSGVRALNRESEDQDPWPLGLDLSCDRRGIFTLLGPQFLRLENGKIILRVTAQTRRDKAGEHPQERTAL